MPAPDVARTLALQLTGPDAPRHGSERLAAQHEAEEDADYGDEGLDDNVEWQRCGCSDSGGRARSGGIAG